MAVGLFPNGQRGSSLCGPLVVSSCVAWDMELSDKVKYYTLFSVLFWSLDMLLGFVTGYVVNSRVESQLRNGNTLSADAIGNMLSFAVRDVCYLCVVCVVCGAFCSVCSLLFSSLLFSALLFLLLSFFLLPFLFYL